ncbi:MAG: ABC transporter permease [Acidobacteriia bacterium]|nr:ABC transporter permease [Terriglobia bacterium]
MDHLLRDLRYGLRMIAKNPAFSVIAVLTLALGIGANSAIFTVTNALLLRPLPYENPGQLAVVYISRNDAPGQIGPFSLPRFNLLNEQNRSFSGMAAFAGEYFNLTGRGDPEQVSSARVSWNFFDVLGVHPFLGRSFVREEGQPGGRDVALITYSLWLRQFGGDRGIVGQSVQLDSRPYTVVGVLPSNFTFGFLSSKTDVWVPRIDELNLLTSAQIQGGAGYLDAVARLRPSVTTRQAHEDMEVLSSRYRQENPGRPDADPRLGTEVTNLQEATVANFRPAVLILLGAVGLVLLIACANVASLLLARALARRKEMAVRAAIGAGRGTIVRQLLTESVLLACMGGILGIFLGIAGTRLLSILGRNNLPPTLNLHLDWRVLFFTAFISLLSGLLFGLMPSLHVARTDVNTVLHDEARGSAGSRTRSYARSALVVAQVTLSMVLLVGSGLLIRSFVRLLTANPGFDPSNVLTLSVSLPPARYPARAQLISFYNETLRRMQTLPGVRAVAISSALPVNPIRFSPVLVEGQPEVPLGQRPILSIRTISPDYSRVMRVPLLRGRLFDVHDDASRPQAAIVNQALVHRFWPNENPIGKRLWLGRMTTPTEVVGVFGDERNLSLTADPNPEVFMPFPELPWALLKLSLRTDGDPHSLIPEVRRQVAAIDINQPVTDVQTMDELLNTARASSRFTMFLLGLFAAMALILAVVGIYGVIAYSVTQRTQEMGVRLALGATPNDILKLIIFQGLILAMIGISGGVVIGLAVTRMMNTLLFQITANDPLTFVGSAAIFAAVALLASYWPARRAMRIDPAGALRAE